jgi:CDP-4-dehydro-6-deoxyglucose reductase, E3
MRSEPGVPLAFVAGGTGFAPVKAMIEQQLALDSGRDILLCWGVGTAEDLYEIDAIGGWAEQDANFRCVLAVEHGPLPLTLPAQVRARSGNLSQVIEASGEPLAGRDAYVAGPPTMMPVVLSALSQLGVQQDRIRVDSFGV